MTEPNDSSGAGATYGWRRPSLRRRVLAAIAALSAAGLIGAGAPALLFERQRVGDRIERQLAQEVREFTELAASGIDPDTGQGFTDAERLFTVSMQRKVPDENETHVGYLTGSAIVQADGDGDVHADPAFRAEVTAHENPAFGDYTSPAHGRITYAVMPVVQGADRGHYVAFYYLDRELAELHDTIRSYAIAAVIAWLVLLLAAWLLVRRLLRPMEELRATAEAITETDLSRRLAVHGDDEVADLSRQFNGMLDRLQEALGAQRGMLDDAGHELRTPITVLRGHLELMDADDRGDVEAVRALAIDELDRMSGLVEDLIVLAKARRPDFVRPQEFEVALLVEECLAKARSLGERTWVVDQLSNVWVTGDPRRLTQAMLQLTANAVAVTAPGDEIGFGCARGPHGVQLWVRDTGPGVPPAERFRIFGRHRSGSTGREGSSGLGLAIVMAIAQAHGGTAWVSAAGAAGGARFVIELPAGAIAADPDDEGEDAQESVGISGGEVR
ncbi:signal transduction histidine kinase [Kineosphaera limosa]|uniref:histidine kinase n=1 Tax=Kineosphaera limosa NBRC 100340 TaxID=1184609 RepID=K6WPU8_9MICO|nr:HAMP domain-containing sensor histidine kinase [Kineosphaera limosa]NYE02292.1 signal transduction histidine kinase [Kineosphaera limosa]GAB94147.1 putative two-component histidine kinase [Kineosphaera limosa NBRC 100340]